MVFEFYLLKDLVFEFYLLKDLVFEFYLLKEVQSLVVEEETSHSKQNWFYANHHERIKGQIGDMPKVNFEGVKM